MILKRRLYLLGLGSHQGSYYRNSFLYLMGWLHFHAAVSVLVRGFR
jgi:hypothetical protein